MKAGPQGGVDALQDGNANALCLGLEGKRYGDTTRLPLNALKVKLVDAIHSRPGLDLWILATTREISGTDQAALTAVGETMGVAVEIVDWARSTDGLPTLAVMIAAARDVTVTFLTEHARLSSNLKVALLAELDEISAHVDFARKAEQLRLRFTRADIGYDAARRVIAARLRQSMTSLASAKANLGGYSNVLDPNVKRIRRENIEAAIDRWWDRTNHEPCVLLGGEGVGKTWAALSWWARDIGAQGDGRPLTLVIPAKEFEPLHPDEMLATRVARLTGTRNLDFWLRRVRQWLTVAPRSGPRFMLIIDGLNENWMFTDWSRSLQRYYADQCEGQFTVLMSCRPDHWSVQLKHLADLLPRAHEVQVRRFDDAELDAVLHAYGLKRSDMDASMLDLIRVPRLCQLAIELREQMRKTGDVTRERLIFEDWKRRLQRRGAALVLDDREFLRLVTHWGHRLRSNLARRQENSAIDSMSREALLEELGRNRGNRREDLLATLSEIIDGRWLTPLEEDAHLFRLDSQLAPFAIGLSLVQELKSCEPGGVGEHIADALDHYGGQDFISELLRAACAIVIFDDGSTQALRSSVIRAWIGSQNLKATDFESFWRLISHAPKAFLDATREIWLAQVPNRLRDEILIKAFAMATRWPHVAQALQAQATEWLGCYWVPFGYGLPEPVANRQAAGINRNRELWERDNAKSASVRVNLRVARNVPAEEWFAKRLIALLSFQPRAPLAESLVAWAVSRAVMDYERERPEIEWLLRWNPIDPSPTQAAILTAADRLYSMKNEIGTRAADSLLEALATPRAMQLRQPDFKNKEAEPRPAHWEALAKKAVDPEATLTPNERATVNRLVSDPRIRRIWSGNPEELWERECNVRELALGRWAPESWGKALRRVFATAGSRRGDALGSLELKLGARLLVLDHAQLDRFAALDADARDEATEGLGTSVLLARLAGRSAREQIRIIASLAPYVFLNAAHACVFATPAREDFNDLAGILSGDAPVYQLKNLLTYLSAVALTSMPEDYRPLLSLAQHRNSSIRAAAVGLIHSSGQRALGMGLMRVGWRHTAEMDWYEAIHGSQALITGSMGADIAARREVQKRIAPETLGSLLMAHPEEPEILGSFAELVHASLNGTIVRRLRIVDIFRPEARPALALLVQHRGTDVAGWVEALLGTPMSATVPHSAAALALCEVLLDQQLELGMRLWERLVDVHRYSTSRDQVERLPMAAPDGPGIDAARASVLGDALTDDKLRDLALAAIQSGHENWLIRFIQADLQRSCAGMIARGIMLAGWLDVSSAATELWDHELHQAPAPGWLTEVHARARGLFVRNQRARHWLNAFIAERDRNRAYGFFLLFEQCADDRARYWAPKLIDAAAAQIPAAWLAHWKDYVNRTRDPLPQNEDLTLFGEPVTYEQAPWL